MEAIYDSTKLIAQSINILSALNADALAYPDTSTGKVIELLKDALDKLAKEM